MKKILLMIMCLVFTSSCIPALIATGVYSHSKNKQARQQWTKEFNENNVEREKQKLPPLEWCSEAMKFDSSWAKKNPECHQYFPKVTSPKKDYRRRNK